MQRSPGWMAPKGAMEVGKGGERRAKRSPPLPTIHPGTKGISRIANPRRVGKRRGGAFGMKRKEHKQ